MSRAWFRMYAEFVNDPKVQLLAFEDQRHFVALLCLKCNGTLDSEAPSPVFRDRMIAKALGLSPDAAMEAKRRLIEVGIVTDDWQPVKWSERQFESDSSTDRVRKFREKRYSNVSVKRSRNVPVTPQNRTDTEQIQNRADARARETPGLDLAVWDQWLTYRTSIRKPLKPASLVAAAKELAGFGADQANVVNQSVANGWQGLFALKAKPAPKARPHGMTYADGTPVVFDR